MERLSQLRTVLIRWHTALWLVIVLLAFLLLQQTTTYTTSKIDDHLSQHLAEIETLHTFTDLSNFFTQIAHAYGAEYGFTVLRTADLPPGTDIHLLGHAVGDVLYEQKGISGMQYCTHEFRNACSHTVVIGALLEHGLGALDLVHDACRAAPGGLGAYTMCFHGLGHGVLAYTEYHVPEAITLCRKVGTPEFSYREYHECVGGIIMELHSGVHDPIVWEANALQYINTKEPTQICEQSYISDGAKRMCYMYLSPYIFDAAGWEQGMLTDEVVQRSFEICKTASLPEHQDFCSAYLGKEFIVLAQARDIRDMSTVSQEAITQTIHWCYLADTQSVTSACLQEVINSLYWGGENHYQSSITFCSAIPDIEYSTDCFNQLFSNVQFFRQDSMYRQEFCSDVPTAHRAACELELLTRN